MRKIIIIGISANSNLRYGSMGKGKTRFPKVINTDILAKMEGKTICRAFDLNSEDITFTRVIGDVNYLSVVTTL